MYKTLVVLEYCIVCGAEAVVSYARDNLYVIKTLNQFQYIDDNARDQGVNVRQKSRDIVDLLSDEDRLAEARRTRTLPNRRASDVEPLTMGLGSRRGSNNLSIATTTSNSSRPSFDDLQGCSEEEAMRRAMEESKRLHDEAEERRRLNSRPQAREGTLIMSDVSTPPLSLTDLKNTDNLLDMDDAEFAQVLDRSISQRPSTSNDDLSHLYHQQKTPPLTNPFEPDVASNSKVDPFSDVFAVKALPPAKTNDPFADVLLPHAPVNHLSGHAIAKPAMPVNLTPHFSTQPRRPEDGQQQ